MAQRLSNKAKLKSLVQVTTAATVLYGGYNIYRGDERFYNKYIIPVAQLLDPELAHNITVKILKWGLLPGQKTKDPSSLAINVWGLGFKHPIGMAAGFDKQGEAVENLHKIGFSFVEIGM